MSVSYTAPVWWQALRPSRICFIMLRMMSSLRCGLRLLLGCERPFMIASALYGHSRFCCATRFIGCVDDALTVQGVATTV